MRRLTPLRWPQPVGTATAPRRVPHGDSVRIRNEGEDIMNPKYHVTIWACQEVPKNLG